MMFADFVARKGLAREHGSKELLKDLSLGYHEVILKCDGGPALRSAQADVKRHVHEIVGFGEPPQAPPGLPKEGRTVGR